MYADEKNTRLKKIGWWLFKTAALVFFIIGMSYWWYRCSMVSRPLNFSGKILAKHINVQESNYGTSLDRIIVIEDEKGEQKNIFVTESNYAKCEIGKWIVKDKNGFRIYQSNPKDD